MGLVCAGRWAFVGDPSAGPPSAVLRAGRARALHRGRDAHTTPRGRDARTTRYIAGGTPALPTAALAPRTGGQATSGTRRFPPL